VGIKERTGPEEQAKLLVRQFCSDWLFRNPPGKNLIMGYTTEVRQQERGPNSDLPDGILSGGNYITETVLWNWRRSRHSAGFMYDLYLPKSKIDPHQDWSI
jgi:hypothetical protein